MKRKPKGKPVKQLDRKILRPFEKSNNPSSRTIPIRTFKSSRSCTITPEPISVQAQIDRIEEFEQHPTSKHMGGVQTWGHQNI